MLSVLILAQIFQPLPPPLSADAPDFKQYELVYRLESPEAAALQAEITRLEGQLKTLQAPLVAYRAKYKVISEQHSQLQLRHKRMQMLLYRTPAANHQPIMDKIKRFEAQSGPITQEAAKIMLEWKHERAQRDGEIQALTAQIIDAQRRLAVLTGLGNAQGFKIDTLAAYLAELGRQGWIETQGASYPLIYERLAVAFATGRLLKPHLDALRFISPPPQPFPQDPAAWAPVSALMKAITPPTP